MQFAKRKPTLKEKRKKKESIETTETTPETTGTTPNTEILDSKKPARLHSETEKKSKAEKKFRLIIRNLPFKVCCIKVMYVHCIVFLAFF